MCGTIKVFLCISDAKSKIKFRHSSVKFVLPKFSVRNSFFLSEQRHLVLADIRLQDHDGRLGITRDSKYQNENKKKLNYNIISAY